MMLNNRGLIWARAEKKPKSIMENPWHLKVQRERTFENIHWKFTILFCDDLWNSMFTEFHSEVGKFSFFFVLFCSF